MSGGKSQTVSPRVIIAGDIVLSLSHIGCFRGDFMGGGENGACTGSVLCLESGLVPYRKRSWSYSPRRPTLKLGLVWFDAMFWRFVKALQSEDRGQDLAEYCLLTALVALVALGIIVQLSGGMQAVWGDANASLTAGNAAISGTGGAGGADTAARAPAK